jgi:hypothetical protein
MFSLSRAHMDLSDFNSMVGVFCIRVDEFGTSRYIRDAGDFLYYWNFVFICSRFGANLSQSIQLFYGFAKGAGYYEYAPQFVLRGAATRSEI